MFSFGGSPSYEVSIELGDEAARSVWPPTGETIYYDGESVTGVVHVHVAPGKILEHQGIQVQFVGVCSLRNDPGATLEFISLVREVMPEGHLSSPAAFDFEFLHVEKRFESYVGANVALRYYLRVVVLRRFAPIASERGLWVIHIQPPPPPAKTQDLVKLEVGIENALHIEFEYERATYEVNDVIIGKAYFGLVRVVLTHAEISLVRQETCSRGIRSESTTHAVGTYEIMDGAPAKGDTVGIRVFLKRLHLQPTMRDVCKRFSVRWFLNFCLYDEFGRRYFKQHEVTIWRRDKP